MKRDKKYAVLRKTHEYFEVELVEMVPLFPEPALCLGELVPDVREPLLLLFHLQHHVLDI
jgi:hypothetical protein